MLCLVRNDEIKICKINMFAVMFPVLNVKLVIVSTETYPRTRKKHCNAGL